MLQECVSFEKIATYDQVFSSTTLTIFLEGRALNFSSQRMKAAIQKKRCTFLEHPEKSFGPS